MRRVNVSLALIVREGRWFLQRRDLAARVFPGLWEFPGGKAERGETSRQALLRELQEELGWTPDTITHVASIASTEESVEWVFHLFRCEGAAPFSTPLAWGWFLNHEITALPIPPLNGLLLPFLG